MHRPSSRRHAARLVSLAAALLSHAAFAQMTQAPGRALIDFAVPIVAALTVISGIIGVGTIAFGNEAGKRVLMGSGAGVIAVLLMKYYTLLVSMAQN